MNRERILFVVVLAIFALWAFAMREVPEPRETATPKRMTLTVRPVASPDYPIRELRMPKNGVFTLQTNEREHPRPTLPPVEARDLAGNWPPTSRSLSVDRYGMLRRPTPKPQEGEAALALPSLPGDAGAAEAKETEERVDTASLNGRPPENLRVTGVRVKGKNINAPRELPEPGLDVLDVEFFRYAAMLQQDPQGAQNAGVSHVRVRLPVGGFVWKEFPGEIDAISIATSGSRKAWWDGFKAVARIPAGAGFGPRETTGRQLLNDGVNRNSDVLKRWALVVLEDARSKADTQAAMQSIYMLEMEAANLLNRQEKVLELAFDYLARFPREERVLEYVGNILASRSFGLYELALDFFERASASQYAQRRRVEILVRLGRFDEARDVLSSGRAGGGVDSDLLAARVALALGDFDTATSRAAKHTGAGGETGAEANQIMGGVAYAKGDAAGAEAAFLRAAEADPGRSTAYSDLGLALAAQGKAADALVCFARAAELDPIDNTVAPGLGRAWLKLAADDNDGASTLLAELEEANPQALLVRFYRGYAQEQSGALDEAVKLYRATLDDDHRYRVAIARLGVVGSRLVERSGNVDAAKEVRAHLEKAVALNPEEPVLPYILGRFLMTMGVRRTEADENFAAAEKLPAPSDDPDLPLWAQAARAALAYRDDTIEERRVKAQFNAVKDVVRDRLPGKTEKELMQHPVYAYAEACAQMIQENENKVDVEWDFTVAKPRDWTPNIIRPMVISFASGKGATFGGEVDYKGKTRTEGMTVWEHCSLEFEDAKELTGNTFYELTVEGEIPDNTKVDFGVGLVNTGRANRGPDGVLVRRKRTDGNLEMGVDGAESEDLKRLRGGYLEFTKVAWPAGKFKLHFSIYGGDAERQNGRFYVDLNGENVFEKQGITVKDGQGNDLPVERSSVFGRGRGNRKLTVYLWVEGTDATTIPPIRVTKVVLTKRKK
jgi:tetratricopeptide (TPR) repeat protein